MGTPIRLVRNDGGIIELMATTMTMNVDRGVTPLPMPFAGGSRFAFDLNLPKSLITIEGVMTDDQLVNTSSQQEASATIDFSQAFNSTTVDWPTKIDALVSGHGNGDIIDADYAIKINNAYEVYLVKTSSGTTEGLSSGRYYIAVHNNTSARSASDIAASLVALVTTYSSTFELTATRINSPISGATNTAVTLTNVNKGKAGNNETISFPNYDAGVDVFKPYHTQYSGGRDSSSTTNKSAGDKVAELYAVLNNSNNGGGGAFVGGAALVGGGALLAGAASGGALAVQGGGAGLAAALALQNSKYGDYIIAIQIPFSSNVNSNESLFYMPTGGFMKTDDKTADNAVVAGSEYTGTGDEYTAIKGTVANATFVQLGGEPIYSYTINFAPIDWIF
jgi:hypothetical protein